MRIDGIRLKNYRGFEHFETDLHPEMTLLVGENGSGKTALIDALTHVTSLSFLRLFAVVPPKAEDVHRVTFEIGGIQDLQPQEPLQLEWTIRLESLEPFFEDTVSGRPHTIQWELGGLASSEFKQLKHMSTRIGNAIAAGKSVYLPLVVRYPAQRGWSSDIHIREQSTPNRLSGYHSWTTPAESQDQLVSWLRKYTFVELQEQKPVPQLRALKKALVACIPDAVDIVYSIRHEELRVVLDGGHLLAFRDLSDGLRNLVATIGDIAWRASVLNPQLGERAPAETTGIVLIDEVEQHLHPRWQREILGWLTKVFPRLQFVVTTHSPQVIASAKPEWLRVLTAGREHPDKVEHARGLDSNSVLAEIMGTTERPRETNTKLEELFTAIDAERWNDASALHDALARDLGHDSPELVRARWMMEMERGHAEEAPHDSGASQ